MTRSLSYLVLLWCVSLGGLGSDSSKAGVYAAGQGSVSTGLAESRPPELPLRTTAGGEVLLDLEVARDGRITGVTVLRRTPPFTESVLAAVRAWRFETLQGVEEASSESDSEDTSENVLVAALFRTPSFYSALGVGTGPVDVASSAAVVSPTKMVAPPYPPTATGDGIVVAEVRIDASGTVTETTVRDATPGFEAAALDALQAWRFRPAGSPASTSRRPAAIVIFGFREPVTP